MEIPIYTVDAFTRVPFEGNPAAICLVSPEHDLSEVQMQRIAAEMKLSETVFLRNKEKNGSFLKGNQFHIRWFTPTNEVNLCGHATLATAAVLYNELGNPSSSVTFDSLSGELVVSKDGNGFVMNFPLNETVSQDKADYSKLLDLIISSECIEAVEYSPNTKKLLVRLTDNMTRNQLESLRPDISSMVDAVATGKVKGVIVTLRGSRENGAVSLEGEMYDFVSRYFAPWNGIPEDPVTGSAHTVLAHYWGKVLCKKDLFARQCSQRGGDVRMRVLEGDRVDLIGQAVTVLKGSLLL
ncbi:phenazine biosynthesis-like domain-containing protein [Saccostrea echinata]|uniref:phenazine biosynthesis-like domain-containing protein n=1 Tax=Saccostrea echinata TaxID=191078 RepID=UPI002A83BC1A|nr:phenazine biosynthesis-like domain-containing protein [Saccostrea echinata]